NGQTLMAFHLPPLQRSDVLDWNIYGFSIPMRGGHHRNGLLVRLGTKQGPKWGEISPYEGKSKETRDAALRQLLAYFNQGNTTGLYPSVEFGLMSLFAKEHYPLTVSTYPWLSGSVEEIIAEARVAQRHGFTSVKCKVSALSIPAAQELIYHLLP